MNIQAIETVYRGCKFRSRLEARWAVFYDALRIKWDYEPEGFVLPGGGKYLPDFYLPDYGWVEIKGEAPTQREKEKVYYLAEVTKKTCYIFFGGFPDPEELDEFDFHESSLAVFPDVGDYGGGTGTDFPYVWCECKECGAIGIQFDGRSARNKHNHGCSIIERRKTNVYPDKNYNAVSPRLLAAYNAGRAARFEFGESG